MKDFCRNPTYYVVVKIMSLIALAINFGILVYSLVSEIKQVDIHLESLVAIIYLLMIPIFFVGFNGQKETKIIGIIVMAFKFIYSSLLEGKKVDGKFNYHYFDEIIAIVLTFIILCAQGCRSPLKYSINPFTWLNVFHPGNYIQLFCVYYILSESVSIFKGNTSMIKL